jgi:murein DD-endopeptidase MepM/ murein hydrolase activator NlpD
MSEKAMGLADGSSRLWPQARVIVLALITFGAVGCSADTTRFNDHPLRGKLEGTGVMAAQPTSRPGQRGYWSWDGGTAITVAGGDTVDMIAHRHRVPASAIIQANNLTAPSAIQPGQHLVIPRYIPSPISVTPAASLASAVVPTPPESVPPNGSGVSVATGAAAHVAAPGDTAIKISRRYGKSPVEVARANNIRTQAKLNVGDHNIIRPLKAANAQQKGRPVIERRSTTLAARKLAVIGPAEKPASLDSVKGTDGTPSFHWPVRGQVIAGFGPRPDGQRNDGINIAVPENTPIKAADDGVVAYSDNELKSFGNLVLVRHANDYVTVYAHAKELRVKAGDQIKGGDLIGLSGQTGNVDTPQIHFEIRKGSTPVDPMQLLHGG